ncbi:MAG TPA: hypothetical protein VIF62_06075 [Labilithrix sp.]|jgi:hypothetical protein
MHRFAASLAFALLCACSSNGSTGSSADPVVPAGDDQTAPPAAPPPAPPAAAAPDACGTVPKSQCTPANPGSIVRGIVKFDPAHYQGKAPPVLRVFMMHQWTLIAGENKQGGHPHAFGSYTDVDMGKGQVSFALDLCELGTAMWSEENCGFNIVVMLDENGSNDPYAKGQIAFVPDKGELVKMVSVDVSCHAASPCLQITADCVDGDACTTYTPITSCACAANSCPSDDKYCH